MTMRRLANFPSHRKLPLPTAVQGATGVHQPSMVSLAEFRSRAFLGVAFVLLVGACASGESAIGEPPTIVHSLSSAGVHDFTEDPAANADAQEASDAIAKNLADDPTYAGMAIRADALEVSAVGGGSSQLRAELTKDWRVPIKVRTVSVSLKDQQDLTRQLNRDAAGLRANGIPLQTWGPDYELDRVEIVLSENRSGVRKMLFSKYGEANIVITVNDADDTPAS